MEDAPKTQTEDVVTGNAVIGAGSTKRRRFSIGKKKLLLIAAVVLAMALLAGGLYYKSMKDRQDSVAARGAVEVTVSQEDVKYGLQTVVGAGTVVTVSADSLVIKTAEGAQKTVKLMPATIYQKGADYIPGSKDEVSTGKEVSVVYNNVSNEAITVWYLQ